MGASLLRRAAIDLAPFARAGADRFLFFVWEQTNPLSRGAGGGSVGSIDPWTNRD